MKRLLTFLVILALIGYLGFKASVWWLTDQRIAEARSAVEGIGVIDRGGIRSGIEGSVTLVDGSYEDFRLSQPLGFGRLTLDAGSPVALISALLEPQSFPSEWSLRAESIFMAFDAALFRDWVTAAGEETNLGLFAPICGADSQNRLESGDLLGLGVSGLSGEAMIRQEPGRLYAEVTTVETGTLEIHWPGARLQPMDPSALFSSSVQPMRVNLLDGGLLRRLSAYCARESEMTVEAWAQAALASFDAELEARGYRASDQLRALYRKWLTEGGELTVKLNPSKALWGLPVKSEEDGPLVMSDSGTESPLVSYNGAGVPAVFLTAIEPDPEPVTEKRAEAELAEPAQDKRQAGWLETNKDAAESLIGQTVRVTLENGNVVEGRLSGVDEKRLEVVRLVDGGEVAYPIAIRLIATFEVWQRGSAFESSDSES